MTEKLHDKKLLIRITVTVAIVLFICTFVSRTIANSLLPAVSVVGVSSGTLDNSLKVTGTVSYSDIREITVPYDLEISEVYAEPGTRVAEGDGICKVDIRDYTLQYERYSLSLTQLYDTYNAAGQNQKNEIYEEINILKSEMELYKERYLIDEVLRADCAGIVREVYVSAGQTASGGTAVADIIPDTAVKQVIIALSQDAASLYSVGDKAVITYTDETGGTMETATVASAVETKVYDRDSGTYRFTIPAEGEGLYEGQNVEVKLMKTSDYYSNLLPLAAVKSDTEGQFVYVLSTRDGLFGEESFVQRTEITPTDQNNLYVAVDIFNYADKVVVATSLPLTSGQKVRVIEN